MIYLITFAIGVIAGFKLIDIIKPKPYEKKGLPTDSKSETWIEIELHGYKNTPFFRQGSDVFSKN